MNTTFLLSLVHGVKCITLLIVLVSALTASRAAGATSPSELLEKGIYSEETKGDLAAAMELYQQVVAEAKGAETVAAQAQYRLGVCLYKQKNFAQASEAFEKLIKDYPRQKQFVTRAREYLAGTMLWQPAPWADGERLRLDIRFPAGYKFGFADFTVASGEQDGRKVWNLASRIYAGVQQISRVQVDADSMRPINSRWKHTLIGDAQATYWGNRVEIKQVGKNEPTQIDLDCVAYDNEECIQAIRRLPLSSNYSGNLRIITTLGGGTTIPLGLEVKAVEKVEVPAGVFECFKVELSLRQTFWYSTDARRYLVKFEAGGIIAELASVTSWQPHAPATLREPGLALTAPPDWVFFKKEEKDKKPGATWLVLDPEAVSIGKAKVIPVSALPAEARKSARDYANWILEQAKETVAPEVRAGSWKEQTIDGHAAVGFLADFQEGSEKKIAYSICVLGPTNAMEFSVDAPAAEFEQIRPKWDDIVRSCKTR